jgi:pimeloyl-ACP methyl ester carboxylesterase
VAGREPTRKGEKSWQPARYEGAEVGEGSRGIRGRLRAHECTELRGFADNPDLPPCYRCFPRSFKEQMRGFRDLLRQKTSSLFIVLGWSSISIASLMMQSMYLDLVERMVVLCSRMRCPKLILCSATADLSGCSL